jgi:hypothetical protein
MSTQRVWRREESVVKAHLKRGKEENKSADFNITMTQRRACRDIHPCRAARHDVPQERRVCRALAHQETFFGIDACELSAVSSYGVAMSASCGVSTTSHAPSLKPRAAGRTSVGCVTMTWRDASNAHCTARFVRMKKEDSRCVSAGCAPEEGGHAVCVSR